MDLELIVEPPQAPSDPTHDVALTGEDISVANDGGQLTGRISRTNQANGSCRVRLDCARHSSYWQDSGAEARVRQYGIRYQNAAAVAADALGRFDALLTAVLAWQNTMYKHLDHGLTFLSP